MALPWLIGAAVATGVGYMVSSSSSNDDDDDDYDDYYERKREQERRQENLQKIAKEEAKRKFKEKWKVCYTDDSINSPKIQALMKKEEKLNKKIKELNTLALKISNI